MIEWETNACARPRTVGRRDAPRVVRRQRWERDWRNQTVPCCWGMMMMMVVMVVLLLLLVVVVVVAVLLLLLLHVVVVVDLRRTII